MKNKTFIVGIITILIATALMWFMTRRSTPPITPTPTPTATSTPHFPQEKSPMTIEDYIQHNISDISPVHEVLGGTFYVTRVEAHGGAGTVWYEDGHIAVVADFTYTVSEQGIPTLTSFTPRSEP